MKGDERRCMICGYPQSEHTVHTELVTVAGRARVYATGWDCPRSREVLPNEDKFLK